MQTKQYKLLQRVCLIMLFAFTLPLSACVSGMDFSSFGSKNSSASQASSSTETSESSAQNSEANTSQKQEGIRASVIDSSNWKTIPIGRYFIKVPPTAEIVYWHPLKFGGRFELKEVKNKTLAQAREELAKEAEEAKKAPHEDGTNQLINFHKEYSSVSVRLARNPHEHTDAILAKIYFLSTDNLYNTKLKKKLFYYEELCPNLPVLTKPMADFIDHLHDYTMLVDPTIPYTRTATMYFEGGQLAGPHGGVLWPTEEIGCEISFPEYPGIRLSYYYNNANRDISVGRLNSRLDGRPAHEELKTFTPKDSDVLHYHFKIENPCVANNDDISYRTPYVRLSLKNEIGGVVIDGKSTYTPARTSSSFASEAEAFDFWEELKKGFRRIPEDNDGSGPLCYFIVNGEEFEVEPLKKR